MQDRGVVFRDASQLARIPSASLSAIFRRVLIIIRLAGREPKSLHSHAPHPDPREPKNTRDPLPSRLFGRNFYDFYSVSSSFIIKIISRIYIILLLLYNGRLVLCVHVCTDQPQHDKRYHGSVR